MYKKIPKFIMFTIFPCLILALGANAMEKEQRDPGPREKCMTECQTDFERYTYFVRGIHQRLKSPWEEDEAKIAALKNVRDIMDQAYRCRTDCMRKPKVEKTQTKQ